METPKFGPRTCVAERFDLQEVVYQVSLGPGLSPEQLLFLRQWLKESWSREFSEGNLRWFPKECEDSFLCAATSENESLEATRALARALTGPSSLALFSARKAALTAAKELDANSSTWFLATREAALRRNSSSLARTLDDAREKSPGLQLKTQALDRALDTASGANTLHSLQASAMLPLLSRGLSEGELTIAGPLTAQLIYSAFDAEWKERAQNTTPLTVSHSTSSLPEILVVTSYPSDDSWAWATWQRPPRPHRNAVLLGLFLLRARTLRTLQSSLELRVHDGGGLYSNPGFEMSGTRARALKTLRTLRAVHNHLVSASGLPSSSEFKLALLELNKHHLPELDARCTPTPPSQRLEPRYVLEVLRKAGPPLSILKATD